jgi:hypothetical protein
VGNIMSIVLQGSTSGSVTLQEPAVAGTTVLTLPAVSGTILTTGSSGQSIPKAALPTGSVLQVVSVTKTDGFSTDSSATSPVDITGMSATITPSSSSNKILIVGNISYSTSNYSSSGFPNIYFAMTDGSNNVIVQGDANGTRKRGVVNGMFYYSGGQLNNAPLCYLWSPATTSAVTVKMKGAISSGYFSVNFTYNEDNQAGYGNFSGISTITLMEIAA